MKILGLIESLGAGGAERQFTGLLTRLKEENNIKVAVYDKKDFYLKSLQESAIPVNFILHDNILKRVYYLYKYIKEENPDYIISYSRFSSIATCSFRMLGLRYKLLVSERNTTQTLNTPERIKFWLYRFADVIVPNSMTQGEYISIHYPNLFKKLKVINNFVDTGYFKPRDTYFKRNSIVLTVARISPQKNVINYIKAAKLILDKHPLVKFEWYGDYSDTSYFQECITQIEKEGIQNKFSFHPSTKNIVNVYQGACIFCLPSLYEGYPNVICEAMSCSLPIICSKVCDNKYIVKDGVNGFLVDPNDVTDIARAFDIYFCLNEQQISEMKSENRAKVVDKNSVATFVEKYREVLNI